MWAHTLTGADEHDSKSQSFSTLHGDKHDGKNRTPGEGDKKYGKRGTVVVEKNDQDRPYW